MRQFLNAQRRPIGMSEEKDADELAAESGQELPLPPIALQLEPSDGSLRRTARPAVVSACERRDPPPGSFQTGNAGVPGVNPARELAGGWPGEQPRHRGAAAERVALRARPRRPPRRRSGRSRPRSSSSSAGSSPRSPSCRRRGLDPVRCGHRPPARDADPPAGSAVLHGCGDVLAVIREASPIVTALLIAGAGGSAICADLGSRKIREEIDAMEVRHQPDSAAGGAEVLAAMLVALLLNGLVSVVGVAGGYFFNVIIRADPGRLHRLVHRPGPAGGPVDQRDQGRHLRVHRRGGRVLQGTDGRRRPEGRRRRREPERGHHVHVPVRRQLRRQRHLLQVVPQKI